MWDCHCHLTDLPQELLPELLRQARLSGIQGWLSCASSPRSWVHQSGLNGMAGVLIAQGLHPWWATDPAHFQLETCLKPWLVGAVALGECGLDFQRARAPAVQDHQRQVLRRQLQLARQTKLPVVLHCVRAQRALLEELRNFPELAVMVHGFNGSLEEAFQWLRHGAYLSLGPQAQGRGDLMRSLPLDQVLIESDAPSRGSLLTDLHSIQRQWRGHQIIEPSAFEANLCRFLGISQPQLRQKLGGHREPFPFN